MELRNRRISAFTKTVPSVARAMPRVAVVRPVLFASNLPLVSGMIPLVSAVPPISAPRHLGVTFSLRTGEDVPRRREIPPSEMGLIHALLGLVGAPLTIPVKMVQKIAEETKAQAGEELDQRSRIEGDLLEVRMRYEAGQTSEEEYRAREAELRAKLDQLRE